MNNKKDDKLAMAIMLGIAIGTSIGVAIGDPITWIGLGSCAGVIIGVVLRLKEKSDKSA